MSHKTLLSPYGQSGSSQGFWCVGQVSQHSVTTLGSVAQSRVILTSVRPGLKAILSNHFTCIVAFLAEASIKVFALNSTSHVSLHAPHYDHNGQLKQSM